MDGIEPECETGAGCPIPDPGEVGARILGIRGLLVRLSNLVDPGTVCRICNVDIEDLELLALVEDELKEQAKLHKEDHGT